MESKCNSIVGVYVSTKKYLDYSPEQLDNIMKQFDDSLCHTVYAGKALEFLADFNRTHFQGDYAGFSKKPELLHDLVKEARASNGWFRRAHDAITWGHTVVEAVWQDEVKQIEGMELISE